MYSHSESPVKEYIAWLDVETSGTDAEKDNLLEVGGIITDMLGNIQGETYQSLVDSGDIASIYNSASQEVQQMHENNNLWLDLWGNKRKSKTTIDKEMTQWLYNTIPDESFIIYFGGNSITLDRMVIKNNFPIFYSKLSHRSIDVTGLSLFLKYSHNVKPFYKKSYHRALSDCYLSVEEYQYYLQ